LLLPFLLVLLLLRPPRPTLFPYTTLFRSIFMLPPLFPGEPSQIEIKPIASVVQDAMSVATPESKKPARSFSTIHTGFWVASAVGLTMFGFVAFLAIGVLTSNPNTDTIASARFGSSDMGNVYGTWTDIPIGTNQSSIFNASQLEADILETI